MSDPDIRPQPMVVSAFDRACIAAWHARRQHGDRSREYARALVDMEKHRPSTTFCPDCGRPAHRGKPCQEDR